VSGDWRPAPVFTAEGVELIGYHDVGGKPVFSWPCRSSTDRWYLYATHFWEPRLSILDVSDPAEPASSARSRPTCGNLQVQSPTICLVQRAWSIVHRPGG